MKTVSATEIKNRLGRYLQAVAAEPIAIEKSGHPVAVLLSYADYDRLLGYEDAHLVRLARDGEASGLLSADESMNFILERLAESFAQDDETGDGDAGSPTES